MINFTLILAGGISAYAWNKIYKRKKQRSVPARYHSSVKDSGLLSIDQSSPAYDDVEEVKHSYRSSLYAIALVSAGSLFYRPIMLIGLPVLGYGLMGFLKALKHSPKKEVRSPLVVFEMIGVSATLLTQHYFYLSLLLTIGLFRREFVLKTGNLINYYSVHNGNVPTNVWVIRDEVELEVSARELKAGDVVVGRVGETILIEGEVLKGNASVRQFSLQRKMKNIDKEVGDKVYPFTVIDSGTLHINVN
ncbi:MAG: hypothetical protein ACPGSM_17615 [Thiolinea sp.]